MSSWVAAMLKACASPVRRVSSEVLRRQLLCVLLIFFLLFSCSCVTLSPRAPLPKVREHLKVVAIAPAKYVPASNFITFARGKEAGAGKGALVMGSSAAAVFAAAIAAVPPMAMPVMVLAGVLTSVSITTGGAVVGAHEAVTADMAQHINAVIDAAVAKLDVQNELAVRLAKFLNADPSIHLAFENPSGPDSAEARPDYTHLKAAGIDAVLEVSATEVGFESCGPEWMREGGLLRVCPDNPGQERIALYLSAQVRLVRVSDSAELFIRQFRYASPRREVQKWVANDGRMLTEEFELAYRELAERFYDEVFQVTPLELPVASIWEMPGNPLYGTCWLAPVYPAADYLYNPLSPPPTLCPGTGLLFTTIDTLRPKFRWSEFPRDLDRQQLNPAILGKICEVTYDLKMWEVEGCERGRLIYERKGLAEPEHLMEESLAPASRYFWSVRARFVFNGRSMATRWAFFDAFTRNCFSNDLYSWQYYRFISP